MEQKELNNEYEEIKSDPLKATDYIMIVIWVLFAIVWMPYLVSMSVNNLFNSAVLNFSLGWSTMDMSSKIDENQKNWLYKYWWYFSNGKNAVYQFAAVNEEDDENVNYSEREQVELSTKDYDWVESLYEFRDSIYLNFTFEDWKIANWSVYDRMNENDLWELTLEEILRELNPELKYPIEEIELTWNIVYSELEENVIYKYTDNRSHAFVNDSDNDVLLFKKDEWDYFDNDQYKWTIIQAHNKPSELVIQSSEVRTVYFYFRKAMTKDIVKYFAPRYISGINRWSLIRMSSDVYLYNDTDENVDMTLYGENNADGPIWTITLNAWELYKKSWVVEYVVIKKDSEEVIDEIEEEMDEILTQDDEDEMME
jgi:hypothetical protein